LDAEDTIQHACNEVGLLATEEALKNFDTDGSPFETGVLMVFSQWSCSWSQPFLLIKASRICGFEFN
jgi:hypothetical protein